jgi:two-component system chemotaxis response regulator CheB
MDKIRVLVVDTSAEVRKILTEYLSSDPAIEVVGVAANHTIAVRQIEKLRPDVVTLHEDLYYLTHQAVLNHPHVDLKQLPLVVLGTLDASTKTILQSSTHSKRGRHSSHRRRAIVCKTPDDGRFTEICARIKKLTSEAADSLLSSISNSSLGMALRDSSIIGIAVSTGGPNALLQIVSELSSDIDVPIVVTQHMPEQFTSLLAERLNSRSQLRVCEARDNQLLEPGAIYLAPGDRHLTVRSSEEGVVIALSDAPKENSCRPSADVMFRSLADVYGSKAVALVLTGMGIDGQAGCDYIKRQGGIVFAQDEHSSTVWGMPKAVVRAGLADQVLSLSEIAGLLNSRFSKKGGGL